MGHLFNKEIALLFFEGSEKKAEIIVDSQQLCLHQDISDEFWATMVTRCDACIVSRIDNDQTKAFILSESSLFVWSDRLLLITCGSTRLVQALEFFLKRVNHQAILQLIYQRKNEYFALGQPSHFIDDSRRLNAQVNGVAYRFGELYGHHNYLYHLDNQYQANPDNKSCELLAYEISEAASHHLTQPSLNTADIRQFLRLSELLAGFTLDDHLFDPFGYSLNAIRGDQYVTIHVTPQGISSYVSFAANIDLFEKIPQILAILAPASFDLVSFNEREFATKVAAFVPQQYISKTLVQNDLSNDVKVSFAHYIRPQHHYRTPVKLDLSGEQQVF